jgi:hypothetical protein
MIQKLSDDRSTRNRGTRTQIRNLSSKLLEGKSGSGGALFSLTEQQQLPLFPAVWNQQTTAWANQQQIIIWDNFFTCAQKMATFRST